MNEWDRNGKIKKLFCPNWDERWIAVNEETKMSAGVYIKSIEYSPVSGEMAPVPSFLITYWNGKQKRITPKEYEVIYESTEQI